jgi:hypothetical protein
MKRKHRHREISNPKANNKVIEIHRNLVCTADDENFRRF